MPHTNGLLGWVDLVTTDVEGCRSFYQQLYGWESTDMPTPMGPSYTIFTKNGKSVAGMGPQPPDMAAAPSMWNSYVIVDDVDHVLKRVAESGGSVVMPAMDVMTQGRMAMIADPSGAVLGLWQPRDMPGAELFNAPGALAWNELQTRDVASAKAFLTEVFGWRYEPMEGSPVEYYVGNLDAKEGDDKSNCGLMAMPDVVPAEVPNFWAVYFAVEDCDTSVTLAQQLGGQVFMPAMDMGPGRFAGLNDPSGAMFFLGSFPPM